MQNQEIVKIIENLKGRRNYEEKRASKLGFASLYDYFEDKISKKQKAIEDEQKELEAAVIAKSDVHFRLVRIRILYFTILFIFTGNETKSGQHDEIAS